MICRSTDLPEDLDRAAAERQAFDMVRAASKPESPLPDVLSTDQARKLLAQMEGS